MEGTGRDLILSRNLPRDSRSPGPDLNPGPPEHEAGVQRSVIFMTKYH
jgi:hypothetical protein